MLEPWVVVKGSVPRIKVQGTVYLELYTLREGLHKVQGPILRGIPVTRIIVFWCLCRVGHLM